MSVTLRKEKNTDGTTRLRLDIYRNGQRWKETLKNLKLDKATTPMAREMNKELLKQAEAIRVARAAELEANGYSLVSDAGKRTEVLLWMQDYASKYTKKDIRTIIGVTGRFSTFLQEQGKSKVTFHQLTGLLIDEFVNYLNTTCKGEGASSYFGRFKKMMRNAYKKRMMQTNVMDFVEAKPRGKAEKKDILTLDEIKLLAETNTESKEVRRAALFSAMTGLRWVDLSGLKWQHINLKEKALQMPQSKTNENVSVPLNDAAIKLLGECGKPKDLIFDLPTANGANKTLKAWVKRAGITKKITWHNLRHSFGTNLIYNDVDVLTASKLLGHTSLRHTQRYVNAADEMKRKATDKLNIEL